MDINVYIIIVEMRNKKNKTKTLILEVSESVLLQPVSMLRWYGVSSSFFQAKVSVHSLSPHPVSSEALWGTLTESCLEYLEKTSAHTEQRNQSL